MLVSLRRCMSKILLGWGSKSGELFEWKHMAEVGNLLFVKLKLKSITLQWWKRVEEQQSCWHELSVCSNYRRNYRSWFHDYKNLVCWPILYIDIEIHSFLLYSFLRIRLFPTCKMELYLYICSKRRRIIYWKPNL